MKDEITYYKESLRIFMDRIDHILEVEFSPDYPLFHINVLQTLDELFRTFEVYHVTTYSYGLDGLLIHLVFMEIPCLLKINFLPTAWQYAVSEIGECKTAGDKYPYPTDFTLIKKNLYKAISKYKSKIE